MSIEERKQQQVERQVKPVIPEHLATLKIDITFDDNTNQNEEEEDYLLDQQFNGSAEDKQKNANSASLYMSTIMENKNHLGLASCKLIKHYVENYKCLKEVSIVLK